MVPFRRGRHGQGHRSRGVRRRPSSMVRGGFSSRSATGASYDRRLVAIIAAKNPFGKFEVGGLVDINGALGKRQKNRLDLEPESSRGGGKCPLERQVSHKV